ncbi:MAG: hypothetical protein ACRDK7_09260 [Solirubrobacteraceae bacterium]
MLRLSLKPIHSHHTPPASKPAATATPAVTDAVSHVRATGCGYRLEAASRRAGLGSAFGRDRGRQRGTVSPR